MNGYNGWNQPLRVTLTATDNPYLSERLPIVGLLKVREMRTDGYAQPTKMTFQEIDSAGMLKGGPVHVDNAEFSYTGPQADPAELVASAMAKLTGAELAALKAATLREALTDDQRPELWRQS